MANTSVYRPIGQTYAVAVTTTASSSLSIVPVGNDQINYCAFLNTGSTPIAISIAPLNPTSITPASAVLPTAGNTSTSFVLGISMSQPTVIAVPANGFNLSAVGTANTLYVMPVADQS